MEILFVRHAQPAWVKDGRGVLDPDLTEIGESQCRHLSEHATSWKAPTATWVSPTRRTQATASPLVKALSLSPQTEEWLEEMRLPKAWEGAPADTLASHFLAARSRPIEEWWGGIEGGETFPAFHDRVVGNLEIALAGLGAKPSATRPGHFEGTPPEQRLLIVGHGGTNAVALTWLLGLEQVPWAWERFVQAHASVTRLKATPLSGGFVFGLREHSDVQHLPRGLRSR